MRTTPPSDGACTWSKRNADQIRDVLHEILTHVASDKEALVARPETCLLRPHLLAAADALPSGHRPEVDCEDDLTALVQPAHLDQMLANLISNAEKYAGGVVEITARTSGDRWVQLCVIDAGPGVPHPFREQLFDRYTRAVSKVNNIPGTGLGLFITRQLARANPGDVTCEEAVPTGSVFTITLPRPEA
ncbi:MAG: ATP-binding protein [Nocardioides sp.]|uniref:sensor histidine kinase n=1 Tax=Nocardioides sp. TaxID=35761 RepID=UPI0032666379